MLSQSSTSLSFSYIALYILAASLLTLQPCLLVVPAPPQHLHIFFSSVLSPLSVVSTFSSSHSFSTPVPLHLTSNFPRCTPTCHPPQSASGTHISIPLLSALCLCSSSHLLPFSITHAPISWCECLLSHLLILLSWHSAVCACMLARDCVFLQIPCLDVHFHKNQYWHAVMFVNELYLIHSNQT